MYRALAQCLSILLAIASILNAQCAVSCYKALPITHSCCSHPQKPASDKTPCTHEAVPADDVRLEQAWTIANPLTAIAAVGQQFSSPEFLVIQAGAAPEQPRLHRPPCITVLRV